MLVCILIRCFSLSFFGGYFQVNQPLVDSGVVYVWDWGCSPPTGCCPQGKFGKNNFFLNFAICCSIWCLDMHPSHHRMGGKTPKFQLLFFYPEPRSWALIQGLDFVKSVSSSNKGPVKPRFIPPKTKARGK